MRYTYELPVSFTLDQVQQFGELTGDNGPVHSVDGVVQGGFILSMLPKWLNKVIEDNNLGRGLERSVSMILDVKFRNKLQSDKLIKISFSYDVAGQTISKLEWRLFDNEKEYCSGKWVIHKS
jgi:hypothetical protein